MLQPMRVWLAVGIVAFATACGSSSTAPTPPTVATPAPITPAPAPSVATISGHVTATDGGQALSGLQADLGGLQTMTDAAGSFRYQITPGSVARLTLNGASIVPRVLTLNVSSTRDVAVDAIALAGAFDLTFYRELVRNGFDAPTTLQPLRRWTRTPQIYLKTVDEAGAAIDGPTLDLIQATLIDMVPRWTSGALGVPAITRGPDTRVGVSGWITIRFPTTNTLDDGFCGQAQVAVDGGWIDLGYHDPPTSIGGCRVPGAVIAWRTIRHEMGHALGFFHTDNPTDLMYGGTWTLAQANAFPSVRELAHAAIAYARPIGNTDPDADPSDTVNLAPMAIR